MSWKYATFLFMLLLMVNSAMAINFDEGSGDTDTFDEILEPVMKIYNLVKYVASAIAGVMFLFAGISFMTSAGEARKRDKAKHMASYVVVGLFVVWAAPYVVNYVVA